MTCGRGLTGASARQRLPKRRGTGVDAGRLACCTYGCRVRPGRHDRLVCGCGKGISVVCMFCRMPINQFTCLGGCRRASESYADALQRLHVYEFAAGQSTISHAPRHPPSESCAPKSFALHGLRPPLQWCLAWGDPNFQNICTFVVYDKGSFGLYMYLVCDVRVFEKKSV